MRVKVGGKVTQPGFEKLKKWGACWGDEPEREGQKKELIGGQNLGSEALPRSKKGRERREQGRRQERSDCQRSNVEGQVC